MNGYLENHVLIRKRMLSMLVERRKSRERPKKFGGGWVRKYASERS